MTAQELIAKVLELDPRDKHELKEWKVGELATAAPILARMLQKAIEQRDHYHAVCYKDFTEIEENTSMSRLNSALNRIASGEAKGEE